MATLDDLKNALRRVGGFESVEAKQTETQIRLEGRVAPNAISHWIVLVGHLLKNPSDSWSLDYSKHYFIRRMSSGDKLFYAHRLIFQSSDVPAALSSICSVISAAPRPSRTELQEFPLSGAGAHREATSGRGAYLADRAPIGPMARMAR